MVHNCSVTLLKKVVIVTFQMIENKKSNEKMHAGDESQKS